MSVGATTGPHDPACICAPCIAAEDAENERLEVEARENAPEPDWMDDRMPLLRGGSRPMTWAERDRMREREG